MNFKLKKISTILLITNLVFVSFLTGFGNIQTAQAAAPNLNTTYPVAYDSTTGTAYTTTTVGNIDEGIAGADGLFIVAGANSTSSIFYSITATPSDFVKMTTLNYDIRYQITPLTNDTEVLYVQVFKSDKTTALTNEMTVVSTTTALTIQNKGSTAFTGVDTSATKADWDGAFFRIRTTHNAAPGADGSVWSIDAFEATGTYNSPPTVAPNTPTDTATGVSTTPDLVFTGTDANADTMEYNIQVDTVSSFDSHPGEYILKDGLSSPDGIDTLDISGGTGTSGESDQAQGQSFTATSSYTLNKIDIFGFKIGSPTDNVYIEILTGSIIGTVIGTSDNVDSSTFPTFTNSTWVPFTFTTSVSITNGTKYYLRMFRTGVRSGTSYTSWAGSTSASLPNGGHYQRDNNVWISEDATQDKLFRIYNQGLGPLLSKLSITPDATFTDLTDGSSTPFPSGHQIKYTVQGANALNAGTEYFWRVAGKDPSGSAAYGAWSSTYSFTTAGPLDHYLVTVATPQTAAVCATGTNSVTAQDASNATVTDDTSTVNMTSSGTSVTFYTTNGCSSSTTSYTLSSGVANIYYKTNTAQSFTVTATKASSTETGTSSSITVNPGSQTRLVITLPSQTFTAGSGNSGSVDNQTAGTQFTISAIQATDDYFNVITGYSGAKTLAYSGPTGSPTYTTAVSFTSGASTTTLLTTLTAAETTTITVTDGGSYGYASSSLIVNSSNPPSKSLIRGGVFIRGGTKL